MMQYAATDVAPHERQDPRRLRAAAPIAWVTTLGPSGVVNAAPFSFFNVFAEDPLIIMFAVNAGRTGGSRTPGSTSSAPASSS